MKKFIHPPKIPKESKDRTAAILWNLHLQGPIIDKSGRAVAKMADRMTEVGWPMSVNTVNRIVNSLGDGNNKDSGTYPYNYIARDNNGKRTLRIELVVDPEKVAFPPNPFKNWPTFESAKQPPPAEEGETFARQRQFEGAGARTGAGTMFEDLVPPPVTGTPAPTKAKAKPKPKPEPEPVLIEPEVEPEPEVDEDTISELEKVETETTVVGSLEPYRSEATVRANGADHVQDDDTFELEDLPEDLLADLNRDRPRNSMDMVSAAISLLSDAMAAHASEQMHFATDALDRHLDERLGEYRVLQDRLDRAEGRLRHTVGQYEKVVGIARKQRQQIVALQRELARLRPKSAASS